MMTCREFIDLLDEFVSGELTTEQRGDADGHLHLCPPCGTFLETYRLTIRLAQRLPCDPLPDGLTQRLKAVLEANRGPGSAT